MGRRPSFGPGWFLGILLGLSVLGACLSLWSSIRLLPHAGDNDNPEAEHVQIALWTAQNGHVYTSPFNPPYSPAVYGPMLYWSLAGLARLGIASGFEKLLIAGRLIVFFSYLLIPLITYLWSRRAGLPPVFAGLSSALVLAQADSLPYSVTVRPDLPALLLSLLAFYLVSRQDSPGLRAMIGSGFLISLALLFKHTFVAAPLAITVWLLSQRRPREAVAFATAAVVPAALVIGSLLLRGEPVLVDLLLHRHSAFDLPSGLSRLFDAIQGYPTEALEFGLALLGLPTWTNAQPRARLLTLYFVLSWAVAFAAFTDVGGNMQYFSEGWVLCAMLVPYAVQRVEAIWADIPDFGRIVTLLMLVIILSLGVGNWLGNDPPTQDAKFASVFSNRTVLSDIAYVAVHSRKPELLDPWLYSIFENTGYWSPAPVLKRLQQREYDYVVLELDGGRPAEYRGYTHFSPLILHEIENNYGFFCSYGRNYWGANAVVLIPRGDAGRDEQTHASLLRAGCIAAPLGSLRVDSR